MVSNVSEHAIQVISHKLYKSYILHYVYVEEDSYFLKNNTSRSIITPYYDALQKFYYRGIFKAKVINIFLIDFYWGT